MASPASSIPDTSLGLTNHELQILRRAQMEAAGGAPGSTSSIAASRASSQGLLLLNAASLAAMTRHFDRLMAQIQARHEYLQAQLNSTTAQQYDRAGNAIDMADYEMRRLEEVMGMLDQLDEDMDAMGRLSEVVAHFRRRVEDAERRAEGAGTRRREGSKKHHSSSGREHKSSKSGRR